LLLAVIVSVAGLGVGLAMRTSASAGRQEAAPASGSSVVATIEGQTITMADLEASLGTSLTKLEQDLYNLKRDRLEAMIGEKLIEREAAARGVAVKDLLDAEVTKKITAVTDEEVNTFHEANKARLPTAADIKGQIKQYLENQRLQGRAQAFVGELRKKANVELSLPSPPVRRVHVDIEGAPIRGLATAPVTVVEFSDFHCPFCKRVQPTLLSLLARYPDKVRVVYKDLPLDTLHPQARRASEAARCARDQGKFWEYHDKIYEGGADVSPEYLRRLATDVGLDVAAFEQCLASNKHTAGIQADVAQGSELGITGTPGFFINGRALSGAQPLEAFVQIIEDELSAQAK
jgi:protein-disulfide isomerase